ncbi:MAG: D-alanyl-D-alanine carboxypeptidase/D-alanyl-D-alanine-endopeptidase [Phycisphaerales bacterium JB047]
MRQNLTRVYDTLILFTAFSVLCVQSALAGPLDRKTERLISSTNLGGGAAAVYIADLDTGEELASYRSDQAMIPASTMKLLTTGTALHVLGDDFVFKTKLILDESVTPPLLIIEGDGDPALGDPAIFEDEHPGVEMGMLIDQIAKALRNAGVDAISGIVVDDRVFDRNYTHPAWPEDQLNRWYCAQIGGLNFHTNVINIYTQPAQSGSPLVSMQPDAYWVQLNVKAKSNKKSRDTAWVSRPTKANVFTVHGNVSAKSEIPVAVDTPPMYAGRVLAAALEERDITVGDGSQSTIDAVRLVEPGESLESSRTLAIITTPLDEVLRRINTFSHNMYAESLLKRIGYAVTSDPGSWENGAAVIRMVLSERIGAAATESTIISDGSGMSRENRVTPKTFVSWMRSLARSDSWDTLIESMATPGTGTLKKRFRDGELSSDLHAKSGYLTGTYGLAGVLEHPRTHQRVVFSIMLNDVRAGSTALNAKPLIDDIVKEIDDFLNERAGVPAMGG